MLYMSTCSYVHMSSILKVATVESPNRAENCEADHLDQGTCAARRERMLPPRTVEALADTFRVLGDPTRVRILDALSTGELCVCDIASLAGISESAVSHQLRLLRGMRLVRPRRAGRLVYYSVDDHHILGLLNQAMTHVDEQLPVSSSQLPAGSRKLEAGSRKLEAGSRKLEAGSRKLEAGSRKLEAGS
jgi:ArsR family transcriptional regulator, lead/cadmium/zinc/bismuth-responsive transcriptional repressor